MIAAGRLGGVLAVAALVLAGGCGLLPSPAPPAIDGHWILVEIDGRQPPAAAQLSMGGGTVQLQPGCNRGSGSYAVVEGRLELADLALTAMACPGAPGDQEAEFLRIVDGSPTLALAGDRMTLSLTDGSGELVFARR